MSIAKEDNPWHKKIYEPLDKEFYDNTLEQTNIFVTAIARPDCEECYRTSADCSNFIGIKCPIADHVPMSWDWLTWFNVQDLENHNEIEDTGNFDNKIFIENSKMSYWMNTYTNLPQTHLHKCKNNRIFTTFGPGFEDIASATYITNSICENCEETGMAKF